MKMILVLLVKIAELVNDISFALKKIPKIVLMVTDGAVAGAAANMAVAADFVIASAKQSSFKPL